jgi:hypothetical protein
LNIYDWDFKDIFRELGINVNGELSDIKDIMLKDVKALRDALVKKRNKIIAINKAKREKIENVIQENQKKIESECLSDEQATELEAKIANENKKLAVLEAEFNDLETCAKAQNKKLAEIRKEIRKIKTQEEALRKCVASRRIYLFSENNARLTDSSKERSSKMANRIKYSTIISYLNKVPSYTDYISDRNFVMRNVDYKNRDLSTYKYKKISSNNDINPYSYKIQFTTRPEELYADDNLENDTHIYSFGNIQYEFLPSDDGEYQKKSMPFDLIGVTRKDEQGNMQTYHGFIYTLDNVEPEFYMNVVFSNLVMRNAEKNNFGYIGKIEKLEEANPDINDYNYHLIFDETGIEDTIKAASFAMTNEGQTNITAIRTLNDIYDYMDRLMLNMLNKSLKNA